MKRLLTLMVGFLLLFLVGCGSLQNASDFEEFVQYTPYDGNESNVACDTIDEMLTESYHWRKAYAEFLWDREQLNAELEKQFSLLTSDDYEYYSPEIGLIFLDSDDIPELLVYYQTLAPPAPEYYVIYHYVPMTKESNIPVEVYCSGSSGKGAITWKYLPHGNAFYTGYNKCMGGFYDYNLFILVNGKWINWDDMPVIVSRIIAENYGVFDGESINIHAVEPMFSDDWRSPKLREKGMSLGQGKVRYYDIEAMFGSDAVAGLPHDTE